MSYDNLLLEEPEAGIWRLTLNRPHALNALNAATVAELHAAVLAVGAAPGARVLLVTGAGDKAFVAGADIKEIVDLTPLGIRAFGSRAHAAFAAIADLPVPVIAVVNGYALGGGLELALACDWIIASERAVFGLPEVSIGATPGFGGTQRLPRRIGRARALELVCTGRQVRAAEAAAIGLANHVYAPERLAEEALALARTIAGKAPLAVRLSKEAVRSGGELDLDSGCRFEAQIFGLAWSTEDQKEGMHAFIEKRPPVFRGR
ncbi:enoyl-CoA hydratase [Plasticicumulans lactativorans]|uniref:Enoyl-CoA hydratase n=1 Tax=Plasticicumulans lactativorans TaxID=1133106 RepID=A0A4R2LDB4_9GAMM|nr:enoyl-CoA hydratase-related protein [Plasticicumulans lactativorans]TCO80838.1 enoyl-CoA hydratase [Plasticicumulans lactativorans]